MNARTNKLEGTSVVVTGGTRGIGEALVRKFAREGAGVTFSYLVSEAAASELVREVEAAGGEAIGLRADVREPAEVDALIAAAVERFGRLDVVVNNAHMAYEQRPFEETSWDEFQRELDTLVKGPFNTVHAALPHMTAQGSGQVINVGSTMAREPLRNHSFYVTAKNALVGLTRALALELGPRGIRVNLVTPGPLATEHNASFPAAVMQRLGEETPLNGRIGTCEEVADAIVLLTLPEARLVTGSNLEASGGFAIG